MIKEYINIKNEPNFFAKAPKRIGKDRYNTTWFLLFIPALKYVTLQSFKINAPNTILVGSVMAANTDPKASDAATKIAVAPPLSIGFV